jgi:Phage integrase family
MMMSDPPAGVAVGFRAIPWQFSVRTPAGIDDLRLHDLRHGFARVGVNRGVSLALSQRLLGHASPLTTSRYAHLQTHALRTEADGIAASIAAASIRLSDRIYSRWRHADDQHVLWHPDHIFWRQHGPPHFQAL